MKNKVILGIAALVFSFSGLLAVGASRQTDNEPLVAPMPEQTATPRGTRSPRPQPTTSPTAMPEPSEAPSPMPEPNASPTPFPSPSGSPTPFPSPSGTPYVMPSPTTTPSF